MKYAMQDAGRNLRAQTLTREEYLALQDDLDRPLTIPPDHTHHPSKDGRVRVPNDVTYS